MSTSYFANILNNQQFTKKSVVILPKKNNSNNHKYFGMGRYGLNTTKPINFDIMDYLKTPIYENNIYTFNGK
jgi:hypothetical protein